MADFLAGMDCWQIFAAGIGSEFAILIVRAVVLDFFDWIERALNGR